MKAKSKKVIVDIALDVHELITRYQAAYRKVEGKHSPTKAELIAKGIDKVNLQRVVEYYESKAADIQEEKRPPGRPKNTQN
jgi:hypothetical protein